MTDLAFEPRKSETKVQDDVYGFLWSVCFRNQQSWKRWTCRICSVYVIRATRRLCRRVCQRTWEENRRLSEWGERGFPEGASLQLNLEDWLVLDSCECQGAGGCQKNTGNIKKTCSCILDSGLSHHLSKHKWSVPLLSVTSLTAKGWKKNAQNAYLKYCLKLGKNRDYINVQQQ